MSLPKEYVDELNTLNKEVLSKQPSDVLQFCATYFQARLEDRNLLQGPGSANKPQAHVESVDPSYVNPNDPPSKDTAKHSFGHFSAFKTNLFPTKPPIDPSTSAHAFSSPFGGSSRSAAAAPSSGRIGGATQFPVNFNANRRTSVSAESLNPTSFHGASIETVPEHDLTPAQLDRLNQSVGKNFLFNNLDQEALKRVLASLQEKKVTAGTSVIKQGDEGDFFYIVESGDLEYTVNGDKVGQAGPGSSFGELALMYNAPRAATVTAVSDTVLWALDRMTFRRILLDKTMSKRKMYGEILKEVPVLSVLDSYELSKLADAMSSETYEPGQVVIKEGDVGEQFYIIENGDAVVTDGNSSDTRVLQELTRGGYFGEVALLNDLPRQATVTATTKLHVVTLDKSAFQRLLGPVVDILKRQDPTQK